MAKTTIGHQAQHQFWQSARSAKGCRIGGYVFANPRDNTANAISPESFDYLCDVTHPTGGLLRDVKVEVKASGRGSILLTTNETITAIRSTYDHDYLIVVYRHSPTTVKHYRFAKKVISAKVFKLATSRLRVSA